MPRYDVFLEGRAESSTRYFAVRSWRTTQKRRSSSDTRPGE